MRNIGIVGAGEAGLLTAFGLLRQGYDVTLYSDRTSEQIFNGRLPASAYLFGKACAYERELGLAFWQDQGEFATNIILDVCPAPAQRALTVRAPFSQPGVSVDLRAKYARWLAELQRRGGKVVVGPVGVQELEGLASRHELVLVATGKAALGHLFGRDAQRSPHQKPLRHVTALVVRGMKPWSDTTVPSVRFTLTPGAGDYFSMPFFDRLHGMCHALLFEAYPGGDQDRFGKVTSAELVRTAKELVHQYSPWQDEALADIELVDDTAWLTGAITPTVRDPVGKLPSGAQVMGLGDVVLLVDPVAGQGLNNAAGMAQSVTESIVAHGDRPFTADWMRQSFERYWEAEGQYRTVFSNMLLEPPPPHVQQLLGAATQVQSLADEFMSAFCHPKVLWPWILDPEQTQAHIQQHTRTA
ncbi:MAG TPA: styrene monooxygenase/indole monooxygenase family protein [Myxococcaceae bacterium]|nr:styrene monooxygenase/indole monooxygenase family protein [Myxococcaceae bacterium]